jgi:hypothetical protein
MEVLTGGKREGLLFQYLDTRRLVVARRLNGGVPAVAYFTGKLVLVNKIHRKRWCHFIVVKY